MTKKMLQVLFLAAGSFLLIVVATPQLHAQETAPTRRTLSGEIRWKKTIGLPPDFDPNKSLENICQPFYVLVLDPEQEDKPIWFANLLQRGRDKAEYYSCNYEVINVPTNKRLKVVVGMGDPFAKPYGNAKPHWYRDRWVGSEDRQNSLPLPANVEIRLVFDPTVKYVTLTSKNMWLSFEMVLGVVSTRSF